MIQTITIKGIDSKEYTVRAHVRDGLAIHRPIGNIPPQGWAITHTDTGAIVVPLLPHSLAVAGEFRELCLKLADWQRLPVHDKSAMGLLGSRVAGLAMDYFLEESE